MSVDVHINVSIDFETFNLKPDLFKIKNYLNFFGISH